MSLKIGITGASGYIGDKMLKFIPNAIPLNFDVTNLRQVRDVMQAEKPDVVFHLAAITNVDKCEEKENEKKVFQVNVGGTMNVGDACAEIDAQMVLLSTYHIFNGRKKFGLYNEKSRPDPLNYYGFTKMTAEGMRLSFPFMKVIRTSYLFDYHRLQEKISALNSADQYYPDFQTRTFLHIKQFTEMVGDYFHVLENEPLLIPSVLHISGISSISWYEFMRLVSDAFKTKRSVFPRKDELKNVVPRPKKGGLNVDTSMSIGIRQYSVDDGIELMRRMEI